MKARAEEAARAAAAAPSLLTDPAMLAMGLQIVRAVGVKRLIPLLAVGGLALGFLASRNSAAAPGETPAQRRRVADGIIRLSSRADPGPIATGRGC